MTTPAPRSQHQQKLKCSSASVCSSHTLTMHLPTLLCLFPALPTPFFPRPPWSPMSSPACSQSGSASRLSVRVLPSALRPASRRDPAGSRQVVPGWLAPLLQQATFFSFFFSFFSSFPYDLAFLLNSLCFFPLRLIFVVRFVLFTGVTLNATEACFVVACCSVIDGPQACLASHSSSSARFSRGPIYSFFSRSRRLADVANQAYVNMKSCRSRKTNEKRGGDLMASSDERS